MNLFDTYRFRIKFPGKQEQIVYPMNDEITINWKKDKDFRFFRWEMSESLVFRNERDRGVLTFNDFADIEIGAQPCGKVTLKIERKCKGETEWSPFWEGYLARPDREYNVDDCLVTVKPRTEDRYSCLLENWELERNIFQLVNRRVTAKTQLGSIEPQICENTTPLSLGFPGPYVTDCIANQSGWRLLEHTSTRIGNQVLNQSRYVREVVNGGAEPPGGGWVLEGNKWVRPLPVVLRQILDDTDESGPGIYSEIWNIATYTIDNGVLLNDLLLGFGELCGYHNFNQEPTFISNFFGISPDGTQPDNEVYENARNWLWSLGIWQITDISKHAASNNATQGPITFKKLLQDLKILFNVDFYIDQDGVFRLEHFSYFRKEKRLDLTQELWLKYLKGKAKFSFDKERLPIKENFKFPTQTRFDFDGTPIEYPAECSDPTLESNYTLSALMTDLEFIIQNPENWEESPLFGIAALADYQGQYYFTFQNTPLNTRPLMNGHLSLPRLHDTYHKHGRPQEFGRMNLAWTNFDSFLFIKKQEQITIPFGCCDISQFQPEDLVNANFGWSEIDEASYTLKKQVMTLDLKF